MTWDIFNVIGTIAFALSGAFIAIQVKYDLLGVYFLAFVTAFGGGAIRNLLIGVPVSVLWEQGFLFTIVIIVVTALLFFPKVLLKYWNKWGHFFDAIGLAAFAIQGALFATGMGHNFSAILVASLLTGTGGGIIRDVLAGIKPLIFREDIYATWALVVGLVVGLGIAAQTWQLVILFVIVVVLRILSFIYRWRLPRIHLS